MAKIKIIDAELLDLFGDHNEFSSGYIDKQTGEILLIFEDYDEPEQEEIMDKLNLDPDRYLIIQPISSREGFRMMEEFVESLPESGDRHLLTKALSWKKPFSNFKSALVDMGALRKQWLTFQDKELRRLAAKWLEREELDAELVPYEVSSQ
jgi:hypothetical protein